MKRVLLGGFLALNLLVAGPAYAERYGDGGSGSGNERGDCNREGNCNDQRRCQGNNCTDNHKSFSPDLKDSPVTICMPGSTCYFDGSGQQKPPPKDGGQKPSAMPSPACLLSLPWHCDEKPAG